MTNKTLVRTRVWVRAWIKIYMRTRNYYRILGPILFLLHVNDLPSSVKTSQVAMFADDTELFKEIHTTNDAEQLQDDINNLETWSTTTRKAQVQGSNNYPQA